MIAVKEPIQEAESSPLKESPVKQFGENTLNSKGLNLKLNESNLLKVKNEEDKENVDSPFR